MKNREGQRSRGLFFGPSMLKKRKCSTHCLVSLFWWGSRYMFPRSSFFLKRFEYVKNRKKLKEPAAYSRRPREVMYVEVFLVYHSYNSSTATSEPFWIRLKVSELGDHGFECAVGEPIISRLVYRPEGASSQLWLDHRWCRDLRLCFCWASLSKV